jgi:hypothetical protein
LELQQYYPDDRIRIIQRNNNKYQVVVNTDYSQEETEYEIRQIKKEAIANGTFGKVKNKDGQLVDSILFNTLGERAWLQVRTKAFKDWFGDWINDPVNASKVVDENGEPLVVYHGNEDENITEFKKGLNKWEDDGLYFFTRDIVTAKNYAELGLTDGKIYECFLNLRNPVIDSIKYWSVEDLHKDYPNADGFITKPIADRIYDEDLDTEKWYLEMHREPDITEKQYVAINPNQIKSATDNVGTFSKEDNNIYQEHDARPSDGTLIDTRLQRIKGIGSNLSLTSPERSKINSQRWNAVWDIIRQSEKFGVVEEALRSLKNSEELFNHLKDVTIELHTNDEIRNNPLLQKAYNRRRAHYNHANRTISINIDAAYTNNDSASVLLHEIMHAVTLDLLKSNRKQAQKLYNILKEYRKYGGEMMQRNFSNTIYKEGTKQYKDTEFTQLVEFVADIFSNAEVINELKNIKYREGFTLWDRIHNFFKQLFSKGIFKDAEENSLMAKASNELLNLLEMPVTEKMTMPRNAYNLYEGETQLSNLSQQVSQQNSSQKEYIPNNPAYREEPDLSEVAFSK